MAGHSKWANIKHKKAAQDAKRANVFTKLANAITVAAREKGPDPEMNPKLRSAIAKARAANMPKDNIQRAIKRGSPDSGEVFETIIYEGYGPAKSAFLIETITNNRNRTNQDLKSILSKNGGSFAQEGSVMWLFDKFGKIIINSKDKDQETLELDAIDAGAEDIKKEGEETVVLTKPEDLYKTTKTLEEKGYQIKESGFDFVAKNPIEISDQKEKEKIINLFEKIYENDDVQEIYSNINF